jgi:death-on-curing protein
MMAHHLAAHSSITMRPQADAYFVDGNKRTGFLVGILFLELNRYRFTAREEHAAQMVVGLAAGTVDEAAYSAFVRANSTARTK